MEKIIHDSKKLFEQIHALNALPALFPGKVVAGAISQELDQSSLPPVMKGCLHLWNDDLESCHRIVHVYEHPDENYLHAVLHRREKDFGNSLYWYRRAPKHAVRKKLKSEDSKWTPESFVGACEKFAEMKSSAAGAPEQELRRWQAFEMQLLFNHFLDQL